MTRLRQPPSSEGGLQRSRGYAGPVRAWCFPKFSQGRIEFGRQVPAGAIIIARGPEKELRDFLSARARRCYQTRWIGGGRGEVPGTDYLAVPGIPEADSQVVADRRLADFVSWIAANAPSSVRVLPR